MQKRLLMCILFSTIICTFNGCFLAVPISQDTVEDVSNQVNDIFTKVTDEETSKKYIEGIKDLVLAEVTSEDKNSTNTWGNYAINIMKENTDVEICDTDSGTFVGNTDYGYLLIRPEYTQVKDNAYDIINESSDKKYNITIDGWELDACDISVWTDYFSQTFTDNGFDTELTENNHHYTYYIKANEDYKHYWIVDMYVPSDEEHIYYTSFVGIGYEEDEFKSKYEEITKDRYTNIDEFREIEEQ